ncbi:F-box protein [Aspergillus mulundensis]|uniref:Uncharacterized protein n=1 Tax=Aspergillus mulundensis TaxID=1810919 RepID=A0A3D8QZT0_9EURO|nr:hypothetical protein DSM5745_09165 [Aspergillus mulundensis]RDW67299.1 hypothetical protein DSM5745_09165 [Aspergillus mulundensis]
MAKLLPPLLCLLRSFQRPRGCTLSLDFLGNAWMAISNVYCPFCGVILLQDPYPEADPRRTRPWYAEIRGLVMMESISLTGLGLISGRNILVAPVDSELSYTDTEALEQWGLSTTSRGSWAFGFHNSCWRLLRTRLGSQHSEPAVAASVFSQLFCTPCRNSSAFDLGHDYDGASHTHKIAGRPKPVDLDSHLYADPYVFLSLDDLEAAAPLDIAAWNRQRDGCTPQLFGSFSLEIKHEILSYMSTKELATLRLVSRELANLAAVGSLPQSFWRSRFLVGQEADFLFPNLRDKRDWCRLFWGTRACVRNQGSLSLINRRRVRKLIEPFAAIVELDSRSPTTLSGSTLRLAQGQTDCFQLSESSSIDGPPKLLQEIDSFSGQLASVDAAEPLVDGCRTIHRRAQLPQHSFGKEHRYIAITTRTIGARTFVSGIGFFPSYRLGKGSRILGFHDPATAEWIAVPCGSSLSALGVAFCSQGLTGVKFTFTTSESSNWVGVINGPGVAQGSLAVRGGEAQFYLTAGLDLLKMVSLGVGQLLEGPSDVFPGTITSPAQRHLWMPCPPLYEKLKISTLQPRQGSLPFEPLHNIDFGGPGGTLLPSLTRLVFHMESQPNPLVGIEIIYNEGHSVLYGRKIGCALSFLIDSVNGERIDQVGTLGWSENSFSWPGEESRTLSLGLCGLQITTDIGRTFTVAPISSTLKISVDSIQTAEPKHVITGLVALQKEPRDPFTKLGVQNQPSSEPLDQIVQRPTESSHVALERHLDSDKEFSRYISCPRSSANYQTWATLKNVRRIEVSIGIEGSSRSPNCISGLKFVYDKGAPAIVGQWMDAHEQGVFELSPYETVSSLTVWVNLMAQSAEYPTLRLGRVKAVRITTTGGHKVLFHPAAAGPISIRDMQHQYGGGFGEEIVSIPFFLHTGGLLTFQQTDIQWILNSSYDRVRAIVSQSDIAVGPVVLVRALYPPYDEVQKLYFQRPCNDGSKDQVVCAEARFNQGALLGLTFTYKSGAKAQIGDSDIVPGGSRQMLDFPEHGRVVGMDVGVREGDIHYLQFEIEANPHEHTRTASEVNIAVRYQTLSVRITPSAEQDGPDLQNQHFDWRGTWCKDEAQARRCTARPGKHFVYAPPSPRSKMLGLYVGCQDLSSVGAVYQLEDGVGV